MDKKHGIMNAISNKLGRLMSKRGWSVYKLSRVSGITPNGIEVILQKKYKDIKLSTIIILANCFNMTASEFLCDDDFLFNNLDLYK